MCCMDDSPLEVFRLHGALSNLVSRNVPRPIGGHSNYMIFKVSSNANRPVILLHWSTKIQDMNLAGLQQQAALSGKKP